MLLVITDKARGTAVKGLGKPACLAAVVRSRSATAEDRHGTCQPGEMSGGTKMSVMTKQFEILIISLHLDT